jgi:hypothetical protein
MFFLDFVLFMDASFLISLVFKIKNSLDLYLENNQIKNIKMLNNNQI